MLPSQQAKNWIAITGASSGIGRATAIHFAMRGYSVVLVARREALLNELRDEIFMRSREANLNIQVLVISADLSVDDGINQVIAKLSDLRLDLLIHNAAMIQPITGLLEISRESWRCHQALNVEAPLFITQGLTQQLRGGRVIHISSGAAHKSVAGWGAYCVSKAALYRLWSCLKEELASQEIAIASVRPGVVDTEMQTEIRSSEHPSFTQRAYFQGLKDQGQLISPERVAAFLFHLFSAIPADEFSAQEWDIRDER